MMPRWVLAPVLRAWVASKMEEVGELPRPRDEPEWRSPGPHPYRVLIFGGGPAVGWGVLSHALALPGSLGRALSRRTHRGAEVRAIPVPRLKIGRALQELDRVSLDNYDAVVLTLGINDAGALTSLTTWERGMRRLLETVARTAPDLQVFVAGVHPIRSIPVFDSPLGSIADTHAGKMNAISVRLCGPIPNATFVVLTAPVPCGALRFRDSKSYEHWAGELAEVMALRTPSAPSRTRPPWARPRV